MNLDPHGQGHDNPQRKPDMGYSHVWFPSQVATPGSANCPVLRFPPLHITDRSSGVVLLRPGVRRNTHLPTPDAVSEVNNLGDAASGTSTTCWGSVAAEPLFCGIWCRSKLPTFAARPTFCTNPKLVAPNPDPRPQHPAHGFDGGRTAGRCTLGAKAPSHRGD